MACEQRADSVTLINTGSVMALFVCAVFPHPRVHMGKLLLWKIPRKLEEREGRATHRHPAATFPLSPARAAGGCAQSMQTLPGAALWHRRAGAGHSRSPCREPGFPAAGTFFQSRAGTCELHNAWPGALGTAESSFALLTRVFHSRGQDPARPTGIGTPKRLGQLCKGNLELEIYSYTNRTIFTQRG